MTESRTKVITTQPRKEDSRKYDDGAGPAPNEDHDESWEIVHKSEIKEADGSNGKRTRDQKYSVEEDGSSLSNPNPDQCERETTESSSSSSSMNHQPDDQFHTPVSTQFHSLVSDAPAETPDAPDTPPEEEERQRVLSSESTSKEIREQTERWEKAEKRSKYFEGEYQKMMKKYAKAEAAVKEKDRALGEMAKRVEKAEKRAATIQEHSTTQSQRINLLQNEAKVKDANAYELQEKLKGMGDRIQIIEAEKEANDLNYEQYDKTMKSLRSEVRKLTLDNAGLTDQMKRFGGLQNESRELSTKAAKLQLQLDKEQKQLKRVTFERDELNSTLELVQTQAKIYEEDFKTEREDRTRAFAEREKEGERYREEIERLTKQLKSHKGNLSAVESVHLARQQELIEAMKELKKCQEEVQAKTSQVKQYKKQHDGLVSKVALLEEENKLLDEQFQRARNQIDSQSKKLKKPKVGEAELSHMRTELEKQTKLADHYLKKSKDRKKKIVELVTKQDEPKKKDKKKDKSHGITSPVTESEKILYQNLEEENQELRIKVQELKKVIDVLDNDVPVGLEEEEEKRSPSHYEELPSPDEPTWSAANVPKKQATAIVEISEKETGSERRSKSFSGRITRAKKKSTSSKPPNGPQTLPSSPLPPPTSLPSGPPPTSISGPSFNSSDPTATNPSVGQYVNLPRTGRPNKVDEKHDDYVNQSRIQAMIEQSKIANLSPPPPQPTSSPPDDSCLPAPIMVFTDDPSPKQPPLGHIPGNEGSGAGGLGLGYEQGVERRGSAPAWVSGANPQDLHEQQHQLYQYGHASLPGQPSPAPQSPPTPPPSSSANQRGMGPAPPTMGQGGREPSAAETDRMMREEEQRQGGDILSPGIDTAMHAIVENVMEEQGEGGMIEYEREVTGTPFDPNLTCVICQRMFRIGEIQLYRNHTANCSGTMV